MAKDRKFVSETDKLLKQFDHDHPELTQYQEAEILKHRKLQAMRDHANQTDDQSDIWEKF